MNRIHPVFLLLGALLSAGLASTAGAASFTGTVTLPDGRPAFGAMVSVFNAEFTQRQTVYTAEDGSYAIVTPYGGSLTLRARLANYDDATTTVDAASDATSRSDLVLAAFADAQTASDALSASAHNAVLPWQRADDRHVFVSQCNYCHQVGNSTTRAPRSHDAWMDTIRKMEGYFAMVTRVEANNIASAMEKGFDGEPVAATQDYGATADLARAKVEEWNVGDGFSFIHDMDVAADGKFYGTDEGHDKLWVLDPSTGEIEAIDLPPSGLPRGGLFSGMHLAIGIFTGSHGPHSMAQTTDGRIWITNALSSTLMSFDPATKQFQTHAVPGDALYPHTVRVDKDDIVWFTIVASNQIGRFDPKTGQMTVLSLPSNGFFRWISDMLLPTLMRISSWFPGQVAAARLLAPSVPRLHGARVSVRHRRESEGWQHLVREALCEPYRPHRPEDPRDHRVRDADERSAAAALRRRRHLLDTVVRRGRADALRPRRPETSRPTRSPAWRPVNTRRPTR